jgi:hypothetical protein
VAQALYKIVYGEFVQSTKLDRRGDTALQYKDNIEKCLITGWLDEKTTAAISLRYSVRQDYLPEEMKAVYDPISLDFLPETTRLKYTDYKPLDILEIWRMFAKNAIDRVRYFKRLYQKALSSAELIQAPNETGYWAAVLQSRLEETQLEAETLRTQLITGKTTDGKRTGAKHIYNFFALFMFKRSWRTRFFNWFFGIQQS